MYRSALRDVDPLLPPSVRPPYHRLSFFGSVLTPRFRSESDIDILVEFEPEHVPGLFGVARLERELSERFGRKVDLRTAEDLSRFFREEVVSTTRLQYKAR